MVAGLVLVLVGAGGCSPSGFDREAAVAREVAGGLAPAAAECYVDRVVDEVGAEALAPDAPPPDDDLARRLTEVRVDCVGVDALGVPPAAPGPGAGFEGTGPGGARTFGDDPVLDELWAGCERGSGAACDELFEEAPLGSDYEAFGATCGNRGAEPACADRYPG